MALYQSEMIILFNHIAKKQRKTVLFPLDETEKKKFPIVSVDGKDYLEIPKSNFDSAMKQFDLAQIVAHIWFASERCGEKDFAKIAPKLPWHEEIEEHKLKRSIEHAKKRGLDVPEVVFNGGRNEGR